MSSRHLLFSDCEALARAVGQRDALPEIQNILAQFNGLEEINDLAETAPSKRILNLFPTYEKLLDGNRAAEKIGLGKIQSMCPHFKIGCSSWWRMHANSKGTELLLGDHESRTGRIGS